MGETVKRRVLGLLAVAFSTVLIATTPASAHSTDDWVKTSQGAPAGWAHRTAKSYVSGVQQETDIYWQDNGEVWVQSRVWDRSTDGYCAAVQIRYEISTSPGQWAGHWHYRPVGGALDCAMGEPIPQHSANWMARYPTRKVAARACHANPKGEIVECEGTWH
ncbi:hypothetical protein [Streptomyces sp. enrichment culture]|uniref:hypothetical protein n=1 Tax=Streptomyces sp. enrichment culture TaxID=1795815 RepID=UPI003F561D68